MLFLLQMEFYKPVALSQPDRSERSREKQDTKWWNRAMTLHAES
jgi:hypothetical protein